MFSHWLGASIEEPGPARKLRQTPGAAAGGRQLSTLIAGKAQSFLEGRIDQAFAFMLPIGAVDRVGKRET